MKQMILVGGGEVFDTQEKYYNFLRSYELDPYKAKKKRKSRLIHALHGHYECFEPKMPNKSNADYEAWKIRFEKYFVILNDEQCSLVGSSLGGIFLLKRLSENKFPKKISQLHLVAPVSSNEGLIDEVIGNFEFNFGDLPHLEQQCEEIYIYHSKDDPVVPYQQTDTLMQYLPKVRLEVFTDRLHFNQPAFPELLENIGVYTR